MRLLLCVQILLVFVLITACGANGRNASDDGLQVHLVLPAGEPAEYFWYGVAKRTLELRKEGILIGEMDWSSGQKNELEVRKSDQLRFIGKDSNGRVVVEGEAIAGESDQVFIPLRRVL